MVKFLNPAGKLYNRFQSRLSTPVQRKVAKTVKKMRNLGIIPYVGLIKPTDKIPMGSYIQDIEEMHRKTIDPVTGRMFLKHSVQDDLREKTKREKDALDRKIEGLEGQEPREESKREQLKEDSRRKLIRELDIDSPVTKPNKLYREWMIARHYALNIGDRATE